MEQQVTYLRRIIILACLLLTGCTGLPDGIEPVKNFDLQHTWAAGMK